MRRSKQLLVYAAAALVLAGVAALYTQPEFLVQLSNLMWTCF